MKIIDKVRIRDTKNISNCGHKLTRFRHYTNPDEDVIAANCKVCKSGIRIAVGKIYKSIRRTGNLIGIHLMCNGGK